MNHVLNDYVWKIDIKQHESCVEWLCMEDWYQAHERGGRLPRCQFLKPYACFLCEGWCSFGTYYEAACIIS